MRQLVLRLAILRLQPPRVAPWSRTASFSTSSPSSSDPRSSQPLNDFFEVPFDFEGRPSDSKDPSTDSNSVASRPRYNDPPGTFFHDPFAPPPPPGSASAAESEYLDAAPDAQKNYIDEIPTDLHKQIVYNSVPDADPESIPRKAIDPFGPMSRFDDDDVESIPGVEEHSMAMEGAASGYAQDEARQYISEDHISYGKSATTLVRQFMEEHTFLNTRKIWEMGTNGIKPVMQPAVQFTRDGRIRMKKVATMRELLREYQPMPQPSMPAHPFQSVG
jgi:hypothetical protein